MLVLYAQIDRNKSSREEIKKKKNSKEFFCFIFFPGKQLDQIQKM